MPSDDIPLVTTPDNPVDDVNATEAEDETDVDGVNVENGAEAEDVTDVDSNPSTTHEVELVDIDEAMWEMCSSYGHHHVPFPFRNGIDNINISILEAYLTIAEQSGGVTRESLQTIGDIIYTLRVVLRRVYVQSLYLQEAVETHYSMARDTGSCTNH